MMRRDAPTVDESTTLAEFRRKFPLGAVRVVIATDAAGNYAGLIRTSAAFATDQEETTPVGTIATLQQVTLRPEQDASAIMRVFEQQEVDELAVVDARGRLLGVVSEKYVRRRYTEEIEKAQRELFGD